MVIQGSTLPSRTARSRFDQQYLVIVVIEGIITSVSVSVEARYAEVALNVLERLQLNVT